MKSFTFHFVVLTLHINFGIYFNNDLKNTISLFFSAFCLRLTELKIEEHTLVGNSTRLECKYDLQGEKLYTVKWYKDGNEFYRFLPGESPEVQLFEVTGVHVDVSLFLLFFFYQPKYKTF